ncbi:hypothetical protein E2C01_018546 [Portunus trituberculatus]|uniref:Uncharacterized protein n=1 Tax=Portunus trituberculatus TaxID=210409 RepID=A0A5B7DXB8_PORTR|nr:hypothetical protein [Portunus trituberculatus]
MVGLRRSTVCQHCGAEETGSSNEYGSSRKLGTSGPQSAPPLLRTSGLPNEVRRSKGTERRHFKSVPPHLTHVGKDEILSP